MADNAKTIDLDLDVRTLNDNARINLKEAYAGKVILIVNTASRCGFTGQYEGLEKLYSDYKDDGLVVLGFPSNDFNQELKSEEKIQEFCRLTYGVEFPMFEKSQVKAGNADPLFERLAEASGTHPKWNFHKYLIDRQGKLAGSYASQVEPDRGELLEKVQALL